MKILNISQNKKRQRLTYNRKFFFCRTGTTKRGLHDRKKDHFKAFQHGTSQTSALADHAIKTGHNVKWDHFEVLASGRSDLHCKIKENVVYYSFNLAIFILFFLVTSLLNFIYIIFVQPSLLRMNVVAYET